MRWNYLKGILALDRMRRTVVPYSNLTGELSHKHFFKSVKSNMRAHKRYRKTNSSCVCVLNTFLVYTMALKNEKCLLLPLSP